MFGKRQIIGIDLSSSGAKAVVLEFGKSEDPVLMREYAMLPLVDREEPLERVLRQLLRKLRTRCRKCAISAWPLGARLRFFDGKTEPDLVRAVRRGVCDASSLFYEGLEDYVTQCGPVASLRRDGEGSMYVACGIPRSELRTIEKTLVKLRYELLVLQLAPVAVLNAFTASHAESARKEPFILVDFGRARMTVVGGSGGNVKVMRWMDYSWEEIPEPLISAAQAQNEDDEDPDGVDDARSAIFREVIFLLAKELQPVLESFRMLDDSVTLGRIYVSGELSNHRTIMKGLTQELQIQCMQWNPLRHIAVHHKALKDFTLLSELAHLPAAAGAAFQCVA